jgi:hypothetical protein
MKFITHERAGTTKPLRVTFRTDSVRTLYEDTVTYKDGGTEQVVTVILFGDDSLRIIRLLDPDRTLLAELTDELNEVEGRGF